MPRLETEKEPPWNSSGFNLLARARAASSRTCAKERLKGWVVVVVVVCVDGGGLGGGGGRGPH
jgi:hypothetical protein